MKTFDDFREMIGALEIKVRHDELYLLPRLIIFFEAIFLHISDYRRNTCAGFLLAQPSSAYRLCIILSPGSETTAFYIFKREM